jgi:ankyrin repeat protein
MPVADCLSMVHSILAHTAVELDALDEDGATPLHLAASSDGCWPAVEVLLDAGE